MISTEKTNSSVVQYKQEPIFSKKVEDFSILKMSMLIRMMIMASEIEVLYKEHNEYGTQESMALKSILMPDSIVYEIIALDRGEKSGFDEVYIYICTVDKEKEKPVRNFCVYANGDVLVWGAWVVELLESLPSTYEKVRNVYYSRLIDARIAEKQLPEMDEKWDAGQIAEFNHMFNNSGLVSQEVIEDLYKKQRFVIS